MPDLNHISSGKSHHINVGGTCNLGMWPLVSCTGHLHQIALKGKCIDLAQAGGYRLVTRALRREVWITGAVDSHRRTYIHRMSLSSQEVIIYEVCEGDDTLDEGYAAWIYGLCYDSVGHSPGVTIMIRCRLLGLRHVRHQIQLRTGPHLSICYISRSAA
jgi:hypothetical protein